MKYVIKKLCVFTSYLHRRFLGCEPSLLDDSVYILDTVMFGIARARAGGELSKEYLRASEIGVWSVLSRYNGEIGGAARRMREVMGG